jgi:hypothetical protein
MKKYQLAAIIIAATTIVSCSSDRELMEDRQVEIATKKAETMGMLLGSRFDVLDETTAIATVYDRNTNTVVGHQIVKRSISTIDLGSKETGEYGDWSVDGETHVSEPVAIGNFPGEDPLFLVTRKRINVNSTISNGEVEFAPEYTLEYEDVQWSNGDTTIVFNIHWDVEDEIVTRNEDMVTDRLETSFCEYKQSASENGTLTLTSTGTTTPTDDTAVKADFTVTVFGSKWLVGCSVHMSDGTLALALDQDGTPVASRANFWAGDKNDSYNGAYYVEVKGEGAWYPAIARDRNDGMSWTVGQKEINIISYAEADQYSHWGNDNKKLYGQHSVKLTGYSVTDDAQSQTLTFFYNGKEAGTLCYANLK